MLLTWFNKDQNNVHIQFDFNYMSVLMFRIIIFVLIPLTLFLH